MSFLYDEKVFLPIVIGSLTKEAQATPAAPVAPLNPVAIAKKLVSKLSRELTDQPEPLNLASPNDVELKVDNLQSLGTLLKFLSNNKVTLSGERIAYTGAEENSLAPAEKDKLSPVSINESRDAATRKWNAVDYYANLKNLIVYVRYMQQKAAAMQKGGDPQGKVLEVMVGKLIDQVNAIKPDSGLERKPKSTPDKPNEIDDEEVIDNFGSKLLDPKNPTADRGSLLLKAKHVKSRAALNSWLQDSPEAQIIEYDDKGQKKPAKTWTTADVNRCFAIQVLYARAKYWSQIAKTPKEERNFAFYLKKMEEIGPTFVGPDGKACTVVPGAGAGTVAKPSETKVDKSKADPMAINKVVLSLPLRVETLDFDRIDQFFEQYAKLDPASANRWGAKATQYMTDAEKFLIHEKRSFSLLVGARDIMTWLKPPQVNQGNPYVPFLNQLKGTLEMVGNALNDLKKNYADTESGEAIITDKVQLARINAQILGKSSIWESNNNAIETLFSQVGTITPIGPKKYPY